MLEQFDIVENLNPIGRGKYPLLVVLQHDRVSAVATLIVAPLTVAARAGERTRLHPSVAIDGIQYLIFVEELAAVPRRILGRLVGNVEGNRYEIVAALDLLFTGV